MTRTASRVRALRRTAIRGLFALLLAVLVAGPTLPAAHACACGAMEPAAGTKHLGVNSETAAIMFDGTSETIALSMGLQTDSPEVAFLMPLPVRAEARLGGEDLFDELYEHTKPEERVAYNFFPGFGDGSAGAEPGGGQTGGAAVIGRQQVGNYDVVQLTGDREAVGSWLSDNGFRTRADVLDGLGHYLAEGWVVMAVRLVFDSEFAGQMAPLVVTFPTTELVYPMLLSSLAEGTQYVRFYVFADHRQDVSVGELQLDTSFAGWVDAADLEAAGLGDAAAFVDDGRWFLTRIDDAIRPGAITTDLQFADASAGDTEYREIDWDTVDLSWVTLLVIPGELVLVIFGTVTAAVLFAVRERPDQRAREERRQDR